MLRQAVPDNTDAGVTGCRQQNVARRRLAIRRGRAGVVFPVPLGA